MKLSKEDVRDLEEILSHRGWKVYQAQLTELAQDILANLKNNRIRKTEELIEKAVEQEKLQFLEQVIIPLAKDVLLAEKEEEHDID